jgi:predicted amidohydrolase
MKHLIFWAAAILGTASGTLNVVQSGFRAGPGGTPSEWTVWSARPELAPRAYVDERRNREQPGSLAISGNGNAAAYGGWEHTVRGVEAGKWYRLGAYYQAAGLQYEPLQIVARLDWAGADGKRVGQPDYAYLTDPQGEWRRMTLEAPAPAKAASAKIQLYLQNAPDGTVWWDEISLREIAAPSPRPVSVAVVNLKPRETKSSAESVRRFLDVVDRSVTKKADVILLPEGITVVGTGKGFPEVAETIPGPTTKLLGEMAKKKNSYLVAGMYERDGAAIYNTAVLLDRTGSIAGKYRKVYLPREEIEGGLTPGSDYPVFRTDFGTVGILICWDSQYADPARALALNGAELLLMPIWGGNETLVKARAIENRVFVATSGYNYPTHILDPDGTLLTAATEQGSVSYATIDLARRYMDPWLGDMRGRFMKELRLDLKVAHPAGR